MKKFKVLIMTMVFMLFSSVVYADAAPGDVIVTLGEDLTDSQRTEILNELGVSEDVQTVTVSNEEEHKYLGDYIPKAQIGSRAISSSKITLLHEGEGLSVETNNITWVSKEMFISALHTAGVKDAQIKITAPFEVSGTAALTGIIKAYEITTDIEIPEEQKQVANEEMVKSAQLGERIGKEEAANFMLQVKEQIAQNQPQTEEELRELITTVANDLGITLTQAEMDGLVSLYNRMKEMNIDWNQIGNQMQEAKEKFEKFIQSEEGQNILQKAKEFFIAIFEAIRSWFNSN